MGARDVRGLPGGHGHRVGAAFFAEVRRAARSPGGDCDVHADGRARSIDDRRGTSGSRSSRRRSSSRRARADGRGARVLLDPRPAWWCSTPTSGCPHDPVGRAVANAVNLVDGLDGLAAGMIAIAAAAFFVYMIRTENMFGDASAAALLSAITVGICLGFLPWNFYPAKIFMGDSGSLLLGMLLSIATISGIGRNRSHRAPATSPRSPARCRAAARAVHPVARRRARDRPPHVARAGHRPRRQGAHPPPAHGHRPQPPAGRAADVPVERVDQRERARGGVDRRGARPWAWSCWRPSDCSSSRRSPPIAGGAEPDGPPTRPMP